MMSPRSNRGVICGRSGRSCGPSKFRTAPVLAPAPLPQKRISTHRVVTISFRFHNLIARLHTAPAPSQLTATHSLQVSIRAGRPRACRVDFHAAALRSHTACT